jgi:hypothetical protein
MTQLVVNDWGYPSAGSGLEKFTRHHYTTSSDVARGKDTLLWAWAPRDVVRIKVRTVRKELLP